MKSVCNCINRKKKEFRKKTFKRRIFQLISLSNFSIILILSVVVFLGAAVFLKGAAITMSYFISSNIAKDMSSHFFLERMNISRIEDFNSGTKEFKHWSYNIDETLGIDFFTQVQEHIGSEVNHNKRNEKLLVGLEEFEQIDNLFYGGLRDKKLSDVYYAVVCIRIKDKVIYKTGENKYEDVENYINNLSKWPWLKKQISDTIVEVPILNKRGEKVGVVTTCLNHMLVGFTIKLLLIGLALIGALIFIINKIVIRLFAKPVLNPLKEMQDKMDEVAKEEIGEDFGKPITFKKTFYEIERLADSTNLIMCKIKGYTELMQEQRDEMEAQKDELESQKEELETLTSKIKATNNDLEQKNNQLENIFNNVSQGFLTFGPNLKVRQEYSFECKKIFEKNIGNEYFPRLICSGDEEQVQFLDDILRKILQEEDRAKVDLYIPLLPKEISINDRYIHISYKVVKDIIVKSSRAFMLILTDITEKKILERQWIEERRVLKMVVKVISNQEEFLGLVEEFKDFINSILNCALINEGYFEDYYTEIYRQIHTFKGNFSQFDMYSIINELHEIESSFTKEKERLRKEGNKELRDIILDKNFEDILDKELCILEEYLGKDFFNEKDIIKIRKHKILEIEDKITTLLPKYEQNQLISDVRRLRYKSLKELLKSYTQYVLKLSERMGKEVKPFEIDGDDVFIDPDYYNEFIKSLIHIFRNCVDHGIEDPEERFINGKSEIGVVKCELQNCCNNIRITISDDGRGIDLDKVRHRLAQYGLYSKKKIETLDEDELLKAIFNDEFSTREEVTEISGRGVGLSSIRNELDKIGGKVEVMTEKGRGTSFIFTFPLKEEEQFKSLHVEVIMNSLTETAKRYINEQTSIELQSAYDGYKIAEKINLNKITVLINIKGAFNAIFALSINERLAKKLVKGFVIDKLTPEEEESCIDDVVAESTNIILGSSINAFDDMEYIVNIGTPIILCYKGAAIKNIDSNIVTTEFIKDGYRLNLSIISMDNNMIEEVGLWQIS